MTGRRLAVLGAGTMGGGIAIAAASAGFSVQLVERADVQPEAKARLTRYLDGEVTRQRLVEEERAEILSRLSWSTDPRQLESAEVVIEAVVEDLAVKSQLLRRLPADFPGLVATNTSSLSVSALSRFAPDPSRFLGLHFFNPAQRMVLVEVVRGAATSEKALVEGCALVRAIGKEPVLAADAPGFIVNRVARPIYLEALRMLGDGVAPVKAIDRLIEGVGFPLGPFRLMDLIGIDVNLAVSESVYRQMMDEPRLRPHPIQRRMVDAGRLGRKAGQGFYSYE